MAPEVAAVERKGGYNQLCDIWACGITAIGNVYVHLLSFQLKTKLNPQSSLNYNLPCLICIQCVRYF